MSVSGKGQPPSIFISYRIADTLPVADRVAVELRQIFGDEAVFFDRRSLEAGDTWDSRIEHAVQSAKIALVLIGNKWLTERDEDGIRRLDEENDWVRREIEVALAQEGRVIPVLVDGATLPRESAFRNLPSIKDLVRHQAIDLSTPKWDTDIRELVEHLKKGGFKAKTEDEHNHEKQNLRGYLSRLIEKYSWLKLQNLREAGSLQIELEKVYIALKAEPESEYELQQSSKLHETEVLDEASVESTDVIDPRKLADLEARNIRCTYRPARDEVRRARIAEVHTFGDAFRQHHRIVVLGGPGSGKTTLGRWLALQLAKAQLLALDAKAQKNITVLRSQIDPDVGIESDERANLGPVRLPIFLRLSHYARELASCKCDKKPATSLADYLGRDPDSEELQDGMTTDTRNQLFREHLTRRDAVVILDGLDELSEVNRGTVVRKIQNFISDHIPETDTNDETGLPCEIGGNQVIVTSRYVGYKYNYVRANCAHFGIQPMRRPAVERFVHAWSDAVNEVLTASRLTGVDADQLILEIYSSDKPKIRELATNPLLITILATVYWRDGKLPDQRAGIYDRVIESLVEIWLKREECNHLTREQLMAALEPLAADLQENASNNGLVSLTRIADIIEGPLAHVSGIDDPNDRRFREQLDGLLETIRKHVGLLAEQSAGNYAFFHRTFQEFLAARHLLAKRAIAAQKIGEKLDDPIWREPLLLALGFVMIDWGRESQIQLLTEVLAIDGQDALIPRATFLLTDALLEMHKVPTEVVAQIVTRLLTSYSISMKQIQARGLRERIEQMFIRLRQSRQTDVVVCLLAEAIRRPGEKHDLTFAAANIVRQIDWYTAEIVDALMPAVGCDSSDLEWPVCQALLKALNQRPNEQCWIDTASPKAFARLESAHLPMRKLLKMTPDLVALVREDYDWLALLIALYGGLDQALSLVEFHRHQQKSIEIAKSAASKPPVPIEKEAVAPPVLPQVNFSPRFIFWDLQDTGLSRLVQRHLAQKRPARDLVDTFWHQWKHGSDAGAVEALVGLAALGEDVIPILRESLTNSDRQTVAQAALERFNRLQFHLAGPLVRQTEIALQTIPDGIPEQHQLDLLRIALEAHISCGGAPQEVGTNWPESNYISAKAPAIKASLDAEFWAYIFSGAVGDGREKGIPPSVIGSLTTCRSDCLLQAWSHIPSAVNRTAQHHFPWPLPVLVPRPTSPVESYLAMLDAMEGVPQEYHSVAGHVLAQCRSIFDTNPFLLWETLSICEQHGEAFARGYQMNRTAVWDETSRFQTALDKRLVSIATAHERILPPETMFEEGKLDEHVRGASEPYLQFRALGYYPEFLESDPEALEIDLLKSIERIPEPIDRIRAIEFLLMGSPKLVANSAGLPNLDLVGTVMHLLPEITDPENRARTFCRLAMFIPVQIEKLLSGAIEALDAIPDPTRKAMTINEIRAVWGRAPGMAAALDAVAETIAEPWERDKALGRISRLIHTRRALGAIVPLAWRVRQTTGMKDCVLRKGSAKGTLAWTLLYLFNTAEEVERLGTGNSNSDALWDDLLDDPSEAVAGLIAAGLEAGLPITTRNALILDRVLQEDRADDLEPLWPYLGRPEPSAVATISRWSSRLGRPSQWSALVQAEAGRLTPEIVGSVIDLLGDSTDLLRLRASLALHGPTAHTNNPARRWRISRVGAETLDVLAQEAKRSSSSQAMLTTMKHVLHDIHHDSPKAVEKWLQELCEEGEHSPAAWLLGGMESAEQDVVSVLLSGLPSAPPNVQEIVLKALARLSYCYSGASLPPGDIHRVIAMVSEDIRTRLSILPEGTETLLNSVRDAVKKTKSGQAWQQALMLMDKSSEWLDEKSLDSRKTCIERLQAIGAQEYVNVGELRAGDVDIDAWKGSYWIKTDKAAAPLVQDERIQETLIALLTEMESTNNYLGYSNHLLTATEAIARKSPDTFARLASPEDWEPMFTEWTQYRDHWSERLAAVRLLGRLRRVTPRVAQALRVAMEDDPYTQQAAYAAVGEFRHIEGDVFQDVLSMLDDPSTATSAAAARLLVSVAKADIGVEKRRQIINSLQEVAGKPSATRPVFLMDTAFNGVMSPRFVGTLDEILYRSIFEISDA